MTLIDWSKKMELGVPEVDYEHEELIGVINALGDLIAYGGPLNGVEALLGEIHAQIEGHFALEERIMRERGYVGYEAHKEDHDRLLEQLRDIMDAAATMDRQELRDSLSKKLNHWFSDHFRTLDRSFTSLR